MKQMAGDRQPGRKKGNRGMAMTEVTIAFLLLTIIFSMLLNCIRFASNMMMRATDMNKEIEEYEAASTRRFVKTAGNPNPYAETSSSTFTKLPAGVNLAFKDESAPGSTYNITLQGGYDTVSYHAAGDPSGEEETTNIYVYISEASATP